MLFFAGAVIFGAKFAQMEELKKGFAGGGVRPVLRVFGYLLPLLLLLACNGAKRERMLSGRWQAVRVMEGDSLLPVPDSVIRLEFFPDFRYLYHGTLKYREAGYWELKNHLLLTRDTLHGQALRQVRIQRLTEDSLFLEMREAGRKRLLIMGKVE